MLKYTCLKNLQCCFKILFKHSKPKNSFMCLYHKQIFGNCIFMFELMMTRKTGKSGKIL